MTDRELMQQALEVLVWCQRRYEGFGPEFIPLTITALRDRLAQPYCDDCGGTDPECPLAQPQRTHWEGCEEVHPECRKPEPVAWVTGWHDGHCVIRAANPSAILPIGIALYTAQPRREWVGLTDDEIAVICGECAASAHRTDDISYARAIEAKLKEKNNG